jgi:hypothetical protein
LRRTLRDPDELAQLSDELAAEVPADCVLLAWSEEGFALATACAVAAYSQEKELKPERISHSASYDPTPMSTPWRWVSIEAMVGLGPTRPWAVAWAKARGGQQVELSVSDELMTAVG